MGMATQLIVIKVLLVNVIQLSKSYIMRGAEEVIFFDIIKATKS